MKKLLAILLIIAMVIPFGLTAQAESVAKKPFYLVNWGDFTSADQSVVEDFTNTFYMPYFWTNSDKLKKGQTYLYAPGIGGSGTGEAGAKILAASTKKWFDANNYPNGSRYINWTLPATAVHALADICFVGDAIAPAKEWLEYYCKELKAIGGDLDGVTIDVEYLYIYSNYIQSDFYPKDKFVYKKIVEHPEYKEKIRPMLVERGFKFYSPVSDETPEIYSINSNSGSEYSQSRSIWSSVMRSYLAAAITEMCEPLWKYFPDAVASDYQTKNSDPWIKELDDSGSVQTGSGGSRYTAGNSSNDNFYCVRPKTTFFKDSNNATAYPTLPGYNEAVFSNTPFNKFLFDINTAKGTYLSADEDESGRKQVSWWLGHAYYGSASHNAYWSERVLHLAMLNPQIFLGYILTQDCKADANLTVGQKYTNALQITDQLLRMASDLVGYADGMPLNVYHNWNYPFVLSGMYANGRNVYRISPDINEVALEDFLVSDSGDVTFKVGGITVTFPGGKIIKDSKVTDIGTCGYWIETAKDVSPVITKVENYYSEYAAYQETFEQYEVGAEYNYNLVTPEYTWEPKKNGAASATIVADPTDSSKKMLAVSGNYEFKNVKLPDNILGADTYAKYQAWSMSFILPEGMAEDAELQMLYAIHSKNRFKDQGVKVVGGKLYYDNAGEAVEMTGVTLTAGVKYTVVREFDFSNNEAYTCTYRVFDAEGNLLGKAVKIPVPAKWEIPITSIGYSTKKVTGNPVLVDDYKLYTIKVNTDFYLYDAKTGVPVSDKNAPRESATAYRFAWLNSTNTEKSYSLMAAYYDGETKVSEEVIQDMKLAPNENGVFFGEIENKQEGKLMLLYIRDNNPAEDEEVEAPAGDDDTTTDDGGEKTGLDNKLIIIIAAAAAVVVVAVVLIVIIASAKKKKKAAAEAPAAEETPEEKTEE